MRSSSSGSEDRGIGKEAPFSESKASHLRDQRGQAKPTESAPGVDPWVPILARWRRRAPRRRRRCVGRQRQPHLRAGTRTSPSSRLLCFAATFGWCGSVLAQAQAPVAASLTVSVSSRRRTKRTRNEKMSSEWARLLRSFIAVAARRLAASPHRSASCGSRGAEWRNRQTEASGHASHTLGVQNGSSNSRRGDSIWLCPHVGMQAQAHPGAPRVPRRCRRSPPPARHPPRAPPRRPRRPRASPPARDQSPRRRKSPRRRGRGAIRVRTWRPSARGCRERPSRRAGRCLRSARAGEKRSV